MDIITKTKKTYSNALDPFHIPDQDISLKETRCLEIIPRDTLGNDGPIVFNIPKQNELYYNLGDSFLFISASIIKSDKTKLTATDNVAPCNFFCTPCGQMLQ